MARHPKEDLAKFGYKSEMKYKSLSILLYFCLHNENQIYESGDFYFIFFSLLAAEVPKSLLFKLLNSSFGEISPVKKDR